LGSSATEKLLTNGRRINYSRRTLLLAVTEVPS